MLLTSRKLLLDKLQDIENELRGTLRNFGMRVGSVSQGRFEARVRTLVAADGFVTAIVAPLLAVRRVLREQFAVLDRTVTTQARRDKICRRLMTAPGVGPVVALTFRAAVDQPRRFARSKAVGAHFGLTPRRFQSGETDYDGRISKCGDAAMRTALYEAAQVLLTRTQKWCWLKAWGVHVARRRGGKRAIIALARRLAVVLHRMWIDGTDFRWRKETSTATA
jgi:transposase